MKLWVQCPCIHLDLLKWSSPRSSTNHSWQVCGRSCGPKQHRCATFQRLITLCVKDKLVGCQIQTMRKNWKSSLTFVVNTQIRVGQADRVVLLGAAPAQRQRLGHIWIQQLQSIEGFELATIFIHFQIFFHKFRAILSLLAIATTPPSSLSRFRALCGSGLVDFGIRRDL